MVLYAHLDQHRVELETAKIEREDSVRMAQPFNNEQIEQRVLSVLRSGKLVQGKLVQQFEEALGSYIGCKHVVCVNSGTAALHSAFSAVKMREPSGSEVITTPLSFSATANAVIHAGCRPIFVDVDPDSFNIDANLISEKVNSQTLALEPVDTYGLPAALDEINKIAERNGLAVVEDAAEALGANLHGRKVGAMSTISCFSTYATKNLHTAEGGFVSTNSDELVSRVRLFRNQGQSSRYYQTTLGYNFRMLEMCAAIGLEQLSVLDKLNQIRRENALYLKEHLAKVDCIGFQKVSDPRSHSWYLFTLTLDERLAKMSRDAFVSKLKERWVEADVAWPTPIHLQPFYRETFGYKEGDFPVAEELCKKIFQLPIHPFLHSEDLKRIVATVKEVLA